MWIQAILLLLTLLILWEFLGKPSDYPPGPWGLPLIGYIPGKTKGNEVLVDLKKRYGNVVSLRIGIRILVMIYDNKLIKEALGGAHMVDRPQLKMLSILNTESHLGGLISSNGEHWHNIRRFSLRHLRDLGMGKSKLVLAVQTEAMKLVNTLKNQAGKSAPLPSSIAISVLNVIWNMVASKTYDVDDEEILEFDHMLTMIQKSMGTIMLPDFFPWIKYIIPKYLLNILTKENISDDFTAKMSVFLKKSIDDHITTLDINDPRDFIDAYLIEMKNQEDNPSSHMSVNDLINCIGNFFGAGTETTTITLRWTIFYLANNGRIQLCLQKEIDKVLPKGTLATLDDKPRLPYTEAFIHEVLRHSSMVSVTPFHMATVDTKLGGYRIPKGAYVTGVQYWSHYNPENFESPDEFQPERFLNSDGKFVNPKEGFIPFSTGRRQCLGEALARMELFIFLTTMVQSLHFAVPPGKKIDLTPMNVPILNMPNETQDVLITIRS